MKNPYATDAPAQDAIEVDGILCFRSGERPDLWLYVPAAPQPEMVNGRPSLQFFASRDGGILQLGAQWTVSPQQLDKLKRQIPAGAADIDLQPAPATVRQSVLEASNGSGARIPLAAAKSSGFPPYTALFRAQLAGEGKTLVAAALNGREDFLFVRYHVAAKVRVTAHAVLTADLARLEFDPSASREEIEEWLDSAIEEGLVRLETDSNAGGPIADQAVTRAKDLFIDALRARTQKPTAASAASSTLRIEASAGDLVEREFDREADISKWFPAGTGQQFTTVV